MAFRDFAYDAFAPLKGPPLLLVAVVTPLAGLAQAAGMFGLPLLAILGGWVWSYSYLMIEAMAEGLDAPVLAIERTNPWHEPRALVPLLVLLVAGWIAAGPGAHAPSALAATVVVAALLLLPASLSLIAAGCGLAQAFWPPALIGVVAGLGTRYLAVLLLGVAYVGIVGALLGRAPSVVVAAVTQVALYSFGAALGRSLYRRREALDLDPLAAPEHDSDRASVQASREAEALATDLYALLRVRRDVEAWRAVEAWLEHSGSDPTPCRWLRDRALAWGEMRFADRLDGVLVARLVGCGRLGEAIGVVEACWSRTGTLPSQSDPVRSALVAAATRLGHDATAARLAATPPPDAPRA